jgi:hypothetical protein
MDHLPRSIRHAWRQAAEAFVGGHDPAVVAERAEKAIAKTLRREGQIDWLEGLAESVQESWRVGSSAPVDHFVRSLDPRSATGVYSGFVDAARVAAASSPRQDVDAFEAVAHDGVRRMVRKLCLAPLEPAVVGTAGFPTYAVVSRVVDDVLQRLQVVPLARLLAGAGKGRSVRAPRSTLQRKSTKELLDAPI